ncbi:hypothetical protein [Rosistilla oblonga]|uniref:hypothetical protein n=1 Tax=Rosistilla oblonga TaxID=2527990 RepID=UPI0011A2885D|nr:hypothetical protein [Rosistilla oblonga]
MMTSTKYSTSVLDCIPSVYLSCRNHPAAIILPQSSCRNHPAAIILPQSSCRNHPAAIILPQSSCRNHPAARSFCRPMRE